MEPVGNHQEDSFPPSYEMLRFRSAPCSLLLSNTTEALQMTKDGLVTGNFGPGFINNGCGRDDNSESESRSLQIFDHKSQSVTSMMTTQYPRYSGNSSFITSVEGGNSGWRSSGRMDNNRMKPFASSLTRQSISPPGLFSDNTASNGYTVLNGPGSYRVEGDMDGELSPSGNRLKNQNSFSSGPPSLGILPGREDFRAHSPSDTKCGFTKLDDRLEGHGFLFNPWNEPASHFSQNFMSMKKQTENGLKESFDSQVLMKQPDSVPCKIRAKRGCATHPRSIAERVRRTRISERMRKLQELVPNMDKQTNTADMLDLAVEYIKNLQKQFKILSEHRANCKCLSME